MNHPFHRLKTGLLSAAESTERLVTSSVSEIEKTWDRLRDRRICLGVTGLSASGKSTFLTSFIYQLMHFQKATLPAFSPILQERVLGVEVHALDNTGNQFSYESGVESLSSSPASWPQPTTGLSSVLVEIRYKPKDRLLSLPGRRFNRLFIEIRDYPGEWLLDLPMLGMSYLDWSHECAGRSTANPNAELLGYFGSMVESIDPFELADEDKIREVTAHFVGYLKRCKESGLSLIQPGRFLLPDDRNALGAPFFPLLNLPSPIDKRIKDAPDNCYFNVLQSRYKVYIDSQVKPFYQHNFSGIDRQIILVDLLGALNSGKACFDDMRRSLTSVLDSFQYGHNSLLAKLFKPRIDKVVFAASKIDQVLPEQHENTRVLMSTLVYDAYRKAHYKQVDTYCEAIASVRSTSIRTHERTNHLMGVDQSGSAGLMRHPDIPDHIPNEDEWLAYEQWQLRQLNPPAGLQLAQGDCLPHIRLDTVMRELLGDKFI